jgi:hypothetical protein
MTLEQFEKYGKLKELFKVTKENKTIYTVADDFNHCQSRFINWKITPISEEEFKQNYPFSNN